MNQRILKKTIQAYGEVALLLKKAIENNDLESYLEGKIAKSVYSVLKTSEKTRKKLHPEKFNE